MRFGSLFSGIGGIDLGLERAGMTCAWQVERDAYCSAVLAKHWPGVRRYEDVRTFPPALTAFPDADDIDLIAGGFPCQDVSQAGKGEGIDGERSGLWREYARIVRVLRPRFVLVENVSRLTIRGLDRVLGDLAELGFDAEWTRLSAADLGAPHLRQRIFIVAARRPVPDAFRDVLRFEREWLGQQHGEPGPALAGRDVQALADGDRSRREGPMVDGTDGRGPLEGRNAVADPNRERGQGGCDRTRRESSEAEGSGSGPALAGRDADDSALVSGLPETLDPLPAASPAVGVGHDRPCHASPGGRGDESDRRHLPMWPPAPDDLHAWRQVPTEAQPAICGLADGLPAEMGRARRSALKAFGNSCVPRKVEVIGRRLMELA